MNQHITVVGILHIGLGILGALAGVFFFVLFGLLNTFVHEHEAQFIFPLLATFLGGGLVVASSLGIIGGIGVLKYKEWARILVLVISAINLMNIPIGTAAGAYSIWVLVQNETVKLFDTRRPLSVNLCSKKGAQHEYCFKANGRDCYGSGWCFFSASQRPRLCIRVELFSLEYRHHRYRACAGWGGMVRKSQKTTSA
jgi:hypothetical protein